MKESEIWRKVGENFENHTNQHGSLCLEMIQVAKDSRSKDSRSKESCWSRGRAHVSTYAMSVPEHSNTAYAYGDYIGLEENRDARILAAYWLALEAEEEENASLATD